MSLRRARAGPLARAAGVRPSPRLCPLAAVRGTPAAQRRARAEEPRRAGAGAHRDGPKRCDATAGPLGSQNSYLRTGEGPQTSGSQGGGRIVAQLLSGEGKGRNVVGLRGGGGLRDGLGRRSGAGPRVGPSISGTSTLVRRPRSTRDRRRVGRNR